jgi:hypothetical protein
VTPGDTARNIRVVNTIPLFSRVLLGILGVLLIATAIALAWLQPDAGMVVAFLAGGVLIILVAVFPTIPSKVGFAGGSLEWSPEQLIDLVYQATLDGEIGQIMHEPVATKVAPEETGAPWADLEEARELARNAQTHADLASAIGQAVYVAKDRARLIRESRVVYTGADTALG